MQDTAQLPVRLERLIRPRNRHPCTRTRTHSRKSRTKNEAYMRSCVHTKIISKRRMTKKERGSSEEGENRHITFPYSTISFNFFFRFFVCAARLTRKWMSTCMHITDGSARGLTRATSSHADTGMHTHSVWVGSFRLISPSILFYRRFHAAAAVCAFSAFSLHFNFSHQRRVPCRLVGSITGYWIIKWTNQNKKLNE